MTKINLLDLFRHKHDIKWAHDDDWGKCAKCGKLFCHPPMWFYVTATMNAIRKSRALEAAHEYHIFENLKSVGTTKYD